MRRVLSVSPRVRGIISTLLAAVAAAHCKEPIPPVVPVSVTAVSPVSGPLSGGTSVTISGTNFIDVSSVTIGGSALVSWTVVSSTQITGTTPAATSTGAKDVVVTSSSHGSGTCGGCFSYVSQPPLPQAGAVIAAGWNHTCALTSAGAAYCWGNNADGGLGNGSTTHSSIPVAVSGGLAFAVVTAGSGHTCGLTSAGAAYCWGRNSAGQLGNGSASGPDSCPLGPGAVLACSLTPVAVSGGLNFSVIAATNEHTCGLTNAGAAYCWGQSDFGALGNGEGRQPARQPVAVLGGLIFGALDAGGYHSCGVATAGTPYCWGGNAWGEVGNGSTADAHTPVAVFGGPSLSAISTGGFHSCGLTSAGIAYCWGSNFVGQLGNGSASGPSFCPASPNTGACSLTPVAVVGGLSFRLLATGWNHSCGITTDGAAYCWGNNHFGQLGNGSTTHSSIPVVVSGGLSFSVLATGTSHTCGITTAGAAYCWGWNDRGQLGNGSTTDSSVPVPVTGWP